MDVRVPGTLWVLGTSRRYHLWREDGGNVAFIDGDVVLVTRSENDPGAEEHNYVGVLHQSGASVDVHVRALERRLG